MNILHILSQKEVTGAETFVAAIADKQISAGNTVYIVSDTFHTPSLARLSPHPVSKRTFGQRIKNILFLKRFIAENKIDIVHAHSRAASWVGYFATRLTTVPMISTIHGLQHIHLSSKIFKIYGDTILPVCASIKDQLVDHLRYTENKLKVVRNGLDIQNIQYIPRDLPLKNKKIAVIGRLSGPKGKIVEQIISHVFPLLVRQEHALELHIIGGQVLEYDVKKMIEAHVPINGSKIYYKGFVDRVHEHYKEFDIIIGSGRVAIEALASGSRVVAIGESCCIGFVDESKKEISMATNFGDSGTPVDLDPTAVGDILRKVLDPSFPFDPLWGRKFVEKNYNISSVCEELTSIYSATIAEKMGIHEIPVLMYHRVTSGKPDGTKHGIYVTSAEFESQLRYFSRKGMTTISCEMLHKINSGVLPIPSKPIMLTFDDGYRDNYENAFPLLKKYGCTATIFLIANPEIRSNVWDARDGEPEAPLLSEEQVNEMMNAGIDFGSHSMNHKNLDQCSSDEALFEIKESKRVLEERYKRSFNSFAYPYGALNNDVKQMVRDIGYQIGIATDSGGRNIWNDLFQIRRIPIFPGTSLFQLRKKTSGWYHRYKGVK